MKISPMINAAVAMLRKVVGVDAIEILSKTMYRKADELGVDIIINDEVEVFLSAGSVAEKIIEYPSGIFVATQFIADALRGDNPTTFFKED